MDARSMTDFWKVTTPQVRNGGVFFWKSSRMIFFWCLKNTVFPLQCAVSGWRMGTWRFRWFSICLYIFLVFWFAYSFLGLPFACTFALSSNYEAELRMKKHACLSKCANKFTQMSRDLFWFREGCKWMRIFVIHIVTVPWYMFPWCFLGHLEIQFMWHRRKILLQ